MRNIWMTMPQKQIYIRKITESNLEKTANKKRLDAYDKAAQ